MTGWVGRPATEIAAAVRSGEVTAAHVVAGHLDRIAKVNAELGAFVRVRPNRRRPGKPPRWTRGLIARTCRWPGSRAWPRHAPAYA
jgi:Asp-tRNA(Asn)/Glu-tRNA(Gln) amidotransferase A subunit family amidase